MIRVVLFGTAVVLAVELFSLTVDRRSFLLLASGVAVALVLIGFLVWLAPAPESGDKEQVDLSPVESLQRWRVRTETMLSWSDGTRGEWDRHLRPILAREFQMATGHKQSKDRAAFHESGKVLFGPELWPWVDPMNVSYADRSAAGPGREALEVILERLEKL
ncbi:hypothetical protein [Antrihabitans sp. YC2-6]|uniref:hypothetical protein n=1 Tax=Antrihabitans sp. YC2-6 TaxID=2799498 RepID=UPI0018F68B51|nr:hypothetical protein [Antrihabitans sp. YC2-6]MBJ8345907.1 hypothetical protein [Antrihabitans sp. YC2-6]